MAPAEARCRLGFNDRLFALNTSGLWEGRSDGQIWLGEAIDRDAGALGYTDDRHVCLVSGTRGRKGTGRPLIWRPSREPIPALSRDRYGNG